MLGKEYIGYKKINEKYVQNVPKPKRILGPKCNSPFCLRSKTLLCAQISEEERQEIFKTFWSRSWKEKKVFVCSMIDIKATQRKTTANLYDFEDFHHAVSDTHRKITVKKMVVGDFCRFEDCSSSYKLQNMTPRRVYLSNICEVTFRRGINTIAFRTDFDS